MYKIITALLILLVATSAFAGKINTPNAVLTEMDGDSSPSGRDVYVLAFDFTEAMYYNAEAFAFNNLGQMPAGAYVVGLGMTDVVADVYHNTGATWENWASELTMGYSYWNSIDLAVYYIGGSPFEGINEGPGTYGPASNYYDSTIITGDWTVPPPADDFTFAVYSTYDDGVGPYAGQILSGTLYVEMESGVVGNESVTLGGLKALYR